MDRTRRCPGGHPHRHQPASRPPIAQRFTSPPLDLADASIAEAAARLGIHRIISIDADFDVYRDARGKALVNLLR